MSFTDQLSDVSPVVTGVQAVEQPNYLEGLGRTMGNIESMFDTMMANQRRDDLNALQIESNQYELDQLTAQMESERARQEMIAIQTSADQGPEDAKRLEELRRTVDRYKDMVSGGVRGAAIRALQKKIELQNDPRYARYATEIDTMFDESYAEVGTHQEGFDKQRWAAALGIQDVSQLDDASLQSLVNETIMRAGPDYTDADVAKTVAMYQREAARRVQAKSDAQSTVVNMSMQTADIVSGVVAQAQRIIKETGGLNENDLMMYRTSMQELKRNHARQLQATLANTPGGQYLDETELWRRFNDSWSMYENAFTDEGGMGDKSTYRSQFETLTNLMEKQFTIQHPSLVNALTDAGLMINGEGLTISLSRIIAAGEQNAGALHVAAGAMGMSTDDFVNTLTRAHAALTSPEGVMELSRRGMVSAAIARFAAGQELAVSPSAVAINNSIEILSEATAEGGEDLMNTLTNPGTAKNIHLNGDAQTKERLKGALDMAVKDALVEGMSGGVSVSADGTVSVSKTGGGRMSAIRQEALKRNMQRAMEALKLHAPYLNIDPVQYINELVEEPNG